MEINKLNVFNKGKNAMDVAAGLIVSLRYVIFALFAVACVYCAMSMGKVRINSDLTAFLPDRAETRRGLTVMEEEFVTYGTAQIMVSNVTYERAEALAEAIADVDHVTGVTFDDTKAHYKNAAALFVVSFDGQDDDPALSESMDEIKAIVAPYDNAVMTQVGSDYSAKLAEEITGVLLIAAIVIFAVLLFTSRSYFEVVIFAVVFVVAALLNMGTNFWLGEISSITNSIAVILQLALAIDYAIIFAHRYQDEAAAGPTEKDALIRALSKSIVEISSSSLTTVSGLIALTLMQFRMGYDLGIVLSKGIICSMLTVFLLMPGLILLFPRAMKRTEHRSFVPDITGWGRFLMKRGWLFLVIFALILPFAVVFSSKAEYAFSDSAVSELIPSESRMQMHKIIDSFDPSTTVAVLVPTGDYEKEKAILREAEALPEIKSAVGLANIEVKDGACLTDGFTPRMLSELLDIEIEEARLLFRLYGVENKQYGAVLDTSGSYRVPLVDMLLYLFEKTDQGLVPLDEEQAGRIADLRGELERGVAQLRGENYDRLVLTASVPTEGEESVALVEKVREMAERRCGEGSVLVLGEITSARDLRDSYKSDSVLINVLTIVFVFVILLFTFKSPVAAAVLVFVIQGSIFINFSFQYVTNTTSLFVTNMIVSAIQMGATIDYAIVIMNRYLALRKQMPKKEAMAHAVNESFPTVVTSGAIMTVAGLVIAFRVTDVYIGHIGLAVGRGALISVILVLTVLPQLIVLFDKAIEKTTFRIGGKEAE
ncbi:MAG: MMPL family transporter [Clostridia bacterium]|nr:MMPL family transporter [Clostridia bacterium]